MHDLLTKLFNLVRHYVIVLNNIIEKDNAVDGIDQTKLAHIHRLAIWEGGISNQRLRELFGLTKVRASVWLRQYREAYPDNLIWESASKSYRAAGVIFNQLASTWADSFNSYIGLAGLPRTANQTNTSAVCMAFSPIGTPDPQIFGKLHYAIANKIGVTITYSSMSDPEPHERVLLPHALIRTAQRWHVRGFSETHQGFRDYNLGRISKICLLARKSMHSADDDAMWNELIPVHLIAHPNLPLAQQKVIRQEYFQGTTGKTETCRAALVHYFIQDIHAAVEYDKQCPPDYVLAVFNPEKVVPWLFRK